MTDHYASCGAEQKDVFLDIVEDLLNHSTKFQRIIVPDIHHSPNHILMNMRFGIRRNLLHDQVTAVAGHACVSLIDILRHTFAHKICIGFAKEAEIR